MLKEILNRMNEKQKPNDVERILDKNDFDFELYYRFYEPEAEINFTIADISYTNLAVDHNDPDDDEIERTYEVIKKYIFKTLKEHKNKFKEILKYNIEVY